MGVDNLLALNRLKLQEKQLQSLLRDASSPDHNTIRKHSKDVGTSAKDWHNRHETMVLDTVYKSLGMFLYDAKNFRDNIECKERLQKYENEVKANIPDFIKKAFPSGMNESVLADGGALIPPQYVNELLMRTYSNDLLSRCRMFNQVTSNQLKIPAIDETSRANGSRFGGVTSYRRQEGPATVLTASKPRFSLIEFNIEALYVYVRTTTEMLEDYAALESLMGEIVAQEFQFRMGDELVNGDGVAKMQGIMNSGSKKTTTAVSGQGANTFKVRNVFDMWANMWKDCRSNAVWLIHNTVWPELLAMTQGNFNVFLPNNQAYETPIPTLLGRPVIETEFNQALGTEGDVILFDPSTYLIAQKGDMRSFASMHVYFDTAEHAFRFEMRNDGKSWWRSALTSFKGGGTTSNIITLNSTRT